MASPGNRMHTPDTSERRGAIKATASAGAVKAFRTARPEKPQPLTSPSDPSVSPKPEGVRRSPAGAQQPPGGVGLDDRTAALAGSRRGHRPARFRVMATELQLRKLTSRTPDMTPGMKNTGKPG
jgi:hypothetical protein